MRSTKRIALGLLVVIAALIAVALVRTFTGTSRQITAPPAPALAFDSAAAAERLAGAVRIPTIAHLDRAQDDPRAFTALQAYLAEHFPKTHAALRREVVDERHLLFTWQGSVPDLPPTLLLAHTDVVPAVTPEAWTHPPFSGARVGGFIWGRGTIDDKNAVLGLLEATEALLTAGFSPKRTVILAFGGDEEASGSGARALAALLATRGHRPHLVLDEGGPIAEGLVPGVKRPVALVGISEKGYLSLELSATGKGGHSSMPPPTTAAGRVARAVSRLEANPFPMRIDGATALFMEWLAPEMGFGERLAFRNRWLLAPVIRSIYAKKQSTAALLRTTTAVTMLSGSPKDNVLPQKATAVVNFRVLPGSSRDAVEARVKAIVDDAEVHIRRLDFGDEPSPISDPEGPGFALVQRTLAEVVPEALVVPYLTVGLTDARAYTGLSDQVFRFGAVRLGPEDLGRFHGVDERISEANYAEQIRVYARLIQNADR